ncbi:MAG: hypothetical protein ACREI8_05115, partial [Myxococcota bacterium]
IQAYLRHCVDKYRLRPHIRFGTEISGARLDEAKDVVRPEAQERFNEEIQAALADSAWATNCGSWYKTASGKITNNWKGFTL